MTTKFVIEPYARFKGQAAEQATMCLLEPCGNELEFRAFQDVSYLLSNNLRIKRRCALITFKPRLF